MQFYDSVKMYVWLAVSMFLMVIAFGYAVVLDFTPEWKNYQRDFIKMQVEELEKDYAAKQEDAKKNKNTEAMKQELQDIMDNINAVRHTSIKIEQIIVPELNKVDRCITCHQGILDIRFKDAKEKVFRTHPDFDKIIGKHPPEKYACTICHEGQGYATTAATAHGFVPHWEHPMLESEYIQISCGKCHNPQKGIAMAPWVKKGQDTMKAKAACLGCHKLLDEGPQKNAPCPELSKEGSKRDYEYDYFNVDDRFHIGHNSVLSWHYEHFKDPSKTSPGTKMPNFGLTDEEIKALTIFVLSHKDVEKEKIPVQYLSAWDSASSLEEVPSTTAIPTSASATTTTAPQEQKKTATTSSSSGGVSVSLAEGKKVFEGNCVACHGMQGKGDGPAGAALNPKPANFTAGIWKYGSGEDGIFKTCSKGVPGTAMPAWESQLSETQRKSVAKYIWKTLGKH